MRRLPSSLAIVASLVLAPVVLTAQASRTSAQISAQEIVQRYIVARGGLEKLRAIRTLVFRGAPRANGRPGRQILRARPFYLNVGSEGNDGSPWEAYDEAGLQPRVTDAPGAALRHTAYFDDPLVMTLEPGWSVELTGSERIGDRDAWRLRVAYPDGFVNESFVDKTSWLLIARRFTAPVHAFGASVTSQAILGDYRPVNGVLFPFSLREVDLATGEAMDVFTWQTIEANVPLDYAVFSPPARAATPVSRLVNAIFASRHVTADALGWYHDFQRDPATAGIDIEAAIESVGYECLKNGAVATGAALLEENLRAHPTSARAHFGMGRAYRAAGREADALEEFKEALRLDPTLDAARQAIASTRLKY
jgi:Tetratricopeptide repeat